MAIFCGMLVGLWWQTGGWFGGGQTETGGWFGGGQVEARPGGGPPMVVASSTTFKPIQASSSL